MPDFNVIANVSETLVAVLNDALQAVDPLGNGTTAPIAMLHDLHQPPAPQGQVAGVLAVTLVEAREDAASRNRPRVRRADPGSKDRVTITKSPMALLLRYLLTPWSKDSGGAPSDEDRKLEQKMLGRVAQLFYDGSMLSGTDLRGQGDQPNGNGLAGSNATLKVALAPLTFEEQTRFWSAVQQKYRPSLTYDISVVKLDPLSESSTPRVSDREIQYGLLEH